LRRSGIDLKKISAVASAHHNKHPGPALSRHLPIDDFVYHTISSPREPYSKSRRFKAWPLRAHCLEADSESPTTTPVDPQHAGARSHQPPFVHDVHVPALSNQLHVAQACFVISPVFMIASLLLSLIEIWISVDAVNLQLDGIEQ
jgi:hypothetical protein